MATTLKTLDDLVNKLKGKSLNDAVTELGLGVKYDKDVALIYTNDSKQNIKNIIFDRKTMKPITSQFSYLLYDNDALNYLSGIDLNSVNIYDCHEGSIVLLFYFNDKWYITTRRCLDAYKSKWDSYDSHGKQFEELYKKLKGSENLDFSDLNKEYCYHFLLYNDGKKLLLSLVTEKWTHNIIDNVSIQNIDTNNKLTFSSLEDAQKYMDNNNEICGLIFRDCHTICRLQKRMAKNNDSIIENTLKLYEMTRNKQNKNIYDNLSWQSKKVLYELHGIYIKSRKKVTLDICKSYLLIQNNMLLFYLKNDLKKIN